MDNGTHNDIALCQKYHYCADYLIHSNWSRSLSTLERLNLANDQKSKLDKETLKAIRDAVNRLRKKGYDYDEIMQVEVDPSNIKNHNHKPTMRAQRNDFEDAEDMFVNDSSSYNAYNVPKPTSNEDARVQNAEMRTMLKFYSNKIKDLQRQVSDYQSNQLGGIEQNLEFKFLSREKNEIESKFREADAERVKLKGEVEDLRKNEEFFSKAEKIAALIAEYGEDAGKAIRSMLNPNSPALAGADAEGQKNQAIGKFVQDAFREPETFNKVMELLHALAYNQDWIPPTHEEIMRKKGIRDQANAEKQDASEFEATPG